MSKTKHSVITVRPSSGGARKFAVTAGEPAVTEDWHSNTSIPCQSDQSWEVRIYERIQGRGYVAVVDGDGQWANRGDHGRYLGTGATAEAALRDAWARRGDNEDGYDDWGTPPRALLAAARDLDAEARPVEVE